MTIAVAVVELTGLPKTVAVPPEPVTFPDGPDIRNVLPDVEMIDHDVLKTPFELPVMLTDAPATKFDCMVAANVTM